MGVMKFANNQTAAFTVNPDTSAAKYQSPRINARFTGLQYDRDNYLVYIGNATTIGNFSVVVDASAATGMISGIAF